jgi:hypothetical protein
LLHFRALELQVGFIREWQLEEQRLVLGSGGTHPRAMGPTKKVITGTMVTREAMGVKENMAMVKTRTERGASLMKGTLGKFC